MMNLNILLEFSTTSQGKESDIILDLLEQSCKEKDLFLVTWQRKDEKIRIYSKYSDIMNAIDRKKFTNTQLESIQYTRIVENIPEDDSMKKIVDLENNHE